MVRQVSRLRPTPRKAALILIAALGVLMWHVLACTESPMAWSPDGKDLAFVAMEPYDVDDVALAGPQCYRLIVASNRTDLRLVEQTTDALLTAPAYSPDGKQLCYLRIPLLDKAQLAQKEAATEESGQRIDQAMATATGPASAPADAWHTEDLTLPAVEGTFATAMQTAALGPMQAELVIRHADGYQLAKTIPLELPGLSFHEKGGHPLLMTYLTLRPQYSPDGQWIYLCTGSAIQAVNPDTMEQRILAAPALSATLSNDGRTIAFLVGPADEAPAIGFVRTDGSAAAYVRWQGKPSMSGLAWMDNDTLAVLGESKHKGAPPQPEAAASDADQAIITLVRSDGTILEPSIVLPAEWEDDVGELAISPDGKHMVVALKDKVLFLDRKGKAVATVDMADPATSQPGVERILAQPTFSPDSRTVALRLMGGEGNARTEAIVYYSPKGKLLARVNVPPIPPGTTRPAED